MASQALIWDRKAFPKPCPSEAPLTRPAMSTTLRKAGTLLEREETGISIINVVELKRLNSLTHYPYY